MKIIVWTPDYNEASGGIVCLHKLCHLLREKGEDAYVIGAPNPAFDTPVINFNKIDPSEDVVIYPEIYDGNPAGVKKVVRWFLNKPGIMGGSGMYGVNDWVYHFSPIFWDERSRGQLTVFNLHEELFHPPEEEVEREGSLFLVHKGRENPRRPYTEDATEIFLNTPNKWLLFQKAEVFYSYDPATFVSIQAAMCGCESVVIPHPNGNYHKWRQQPNYKYGISYGLEQREQKKAELDLVTPWLKLLEKDTSVMIDKLLFDIKNWR